MGMKKILVIDDNTVNLAAVERVLKTNYEVIPMISGKRALKYLYCQRVDLILLDVEMPEMDGVETLENIRELENVADTPVIFLTAKKDKQTVLDGFRLKIMDYITKPFDLDDMQARVEYTLKRAGKLPFEKKELVKVFGKIIKEFESGDEKLALNKLMEATKYDTDKEIIERTVNALEKYKAGDRNGTISVINRIYKMLQAEVGEDESARLLTQSEIKEKLEVIIGYIEKFQTKDALASCKELLKCPLPKYVAELITKCIGLLNNYDDEEAEELLRQLVAQYR